MPVMELPVATLRAVLGGRWMPSVASAERASSARRPGVPVALRDSASGLVGAADSHAAGECEIGR